MGNVSDERTRLRWLGMSLKDDRLEATFTDDNGEPVAGIRVIDADGTASKDGYTLNSGYLELWGEQIHTSQTADGTLTEASFDYSNLSVSPTTADYDTTIEISADVTNTGDLAGTAHVRLLEDGAVDTTADVDVAAGTTEQVTFYKQYNYETTVELGIEDLSPVEVTVRADDDGGWLSWG